jgi:hypothetical protein
VSLDERGDRQYYVMTLDEVARRIGLSDICAVKRIETRAIRRLWQDRVLLQQVMRGGRKRTNKR